MQVRQKNRAQSLHRYALIRRIQRFLKPLADTVSAIDQIDRIAHHKSGRCAAPIGIGPISRAARGAEKKQTRAKRRRRGFCLRDPRLCCATSPAEAGFPKTAARALAPAPPSRRRRRIACSIARPISSHIAQLKRW